MFKAFAASEMTLAAGAYDLRACVQLPPPGSTSDDYRLARLLDIVVALAALVFLAPFMTIIALAVWSSGDPILFRHQRIGKGGRSFSCLKFRTMHVNGDALLADLLEHDADARAEWMLYHKLRRDPRVSRVGAFLRKTSLDELPQLFNVLAGTMSIVGPRPIVQAEAGRYRRYFHTYCQVRPGITGLWQISGRNTTTYRRRVACDVAYVRGKSAVGDLRIILRTVPAVFMGHGAY
ncbi:sugar transferase [Sphingomonas sp.]|uniref:sugar transferase n=1 Tax=Sphingomonas sp. TaxID=28214 RepID=UPI003CC6A9F7